MSLSSCRLDAQIAVTEMARAQEFYEGKLGLSPVPRAGGSKVAWFKDPDGNIFSIAGDR
jgi:hypothetical protein